MAGLSKELNKKAKQAMYIVAALNVVTAVMFWIAYSNSGETLYLIASVVNAISSVVIIILAQILMKKGRSNE